MKPAAKEKSQVDKFREAARELETNDSEENFDRVLKRLARAPSDGSKKAKPSQRLKGKSILGD